MLTIDNQKERVNSAEEKRMPLTRSILKGRILDKGGNVQTPLAHYQGQTERRRAQHFHGSQTQIGCNGFTNADSAGPAFESFSEQKTINLLSLQAAAALKAIHVSAVANPRLE